MPGPGGGTVSAAAALIFSKSQLIHNGCGAAIEALQATSDLVSQTKMGQLFKPLHLFQSYQIFFFQSKALWFQMQDFDLLKQMVFLF